MWPSAILAACALVLATIGVVPAAGAQGYPVRPVKIVIPFAAGSGSDIVGRLLAEELRKPLGQSFVVDNKPGASAQIAAEFVAKAPPDGYTLLLTTNTAHSANPYLFRRIAYDPVRDFTPIARISYTPYVLVVRTDSGVGSVAELAARLKARSGQLNYGYGNSTSQVAGAAFVQRTGAIATAVPYKSMPSVLTDLLGGRLDFAFADLTSVHGHLKGGELKPIAFSLDRRASQLPDVPTVSETQGFAGYEVTSWIGLVGPAGTPREVVERLNTEINRVLARPDIRARLADLGSEAAPSTPAELATFIAQQLESWRAKIAAAGIQPE